MANPWDIQVPRISEGFSAGVAAANAREARERRAQEDQRRAQQDAERRNDRTFNLGLQALQADNEINLRNFLPGDTTEEMFRRLEELQKARKRSTKRAETEAQTGSLANTAGAALPSLYAGAQRGDEEAGQALSQTLQGLQGLPENVRSQVIGQSALAAPTERLRQNAAQSQAQAEAQRERFKSLPAQFKAVEMMDQYGLYATPEDKQRALIRANRRVQIGTTSPNERKLARAVQAGLISEQKRAEIDLAAALAENLGGSFEIMVGGKPVKIGGENPIARARLDRMEQNDAITTTRTQLLDLKEFAANNPGAFGLGGSISSAVASAAGAVGSLDAIGAGGGAADLLRRGETALRDAVSSAEGPEAARFQKDLNLIETGIQAQGIEVDRTLIAYALADITRRPGAGRLTVKAVEDMKRLMPTKAIAGPDAFVEALNRLDKFLYHRQVDLKRSDEREIRAAAGKPLEIVVPPLSETTLGRPNAGLPQGLGQTGGGPAPAPDTGQGGSVGRPRFRLENNKLVPMEP